MGDLFSKKFIVAALLAFIVIVIWDYAFLKEIREQELLNQPQSVIIDNEKLDYSEIGDAENSIEYQRVDIINSSIKGSLSLQAGRIDDILLLNHKETLEQDSDNIHIFNPKGTYNAYFFESGWISDTNVELPNSNTVWKLDSNSAKNLTPETPIIIFWENSQGILFKKHISIDDAYLISIKDTIVNNSGVDISINPFSFIVRHGDPAVEDLFISHEGFIGHVNEILEKVDYDDVLQTSYNINTQGGYIGFSDKYWLSSIILNNDQNYLTRFVSYQDSQKINNFQADYKGNEIKLESGQEVDNITRVFVGPKEYKVLDYYQDSYSVDRFKDTIDFGWFFFFTKPMIQFLLFIYHMVGHFGYSILIFTVIIRALILPIAYKSYVSMAKMKELQPKMKELKNLYKGDLQKYNKELTSLYRKEKVNPLSGCLPLLLQIPIFFSIYKVIFISIEMRHAPFIGWVQDMSVKDPTNIFNLFGLIPIDLPGFLHIGVWPILMGLTMFIQQKLASVQSLEPMQQRIMNIMPVILVIILSPFPVGLVIYWTWSNIISIIQQLIINKKVHNKYGIKIKSIDI